MHSDFTLFPRKTSSGQKRWYVRFRDENGERMSAISVETIRKKLGIRNLNPIPTDDTDDLAKSKRRERGIDIAFALCEKFVNNKLVSTLKLKDDSFISFVESYWDFDNPKGYIARKNKRKGKTIGRAYADNQLKSFQKNAKPLITSGLKTSEVTREILERIQNNLLDSGVLSNRTIISVMQSMTLPLKEAYRTGLILDNPADKLETIERNANDRGIPEVAEMRRIIEILRPQTNEFSTAYSIYVAILLDVLTGLRGGEIRALTVDSIEKVPQLDYSILHVEHSWSDGEQIKETKNRVSRIVPISTKLSEMLINLAEQNPMKNQIGQSFLFWSPTNPEVAINVSTMRDHFYEAYSLIDVEEIENTNYENTDEKAEAIKKAKAARAAERERKNITFHSIRHFFTSMMDGTRMSRSALDAYVGHAKKSITDVYIHNLKEKMANDLETINETMASVIPEAGGEKNG